MNSIRQHKLWVAVLFLLFVAGCASEPELPPPSLLTPTEQLGQTVFTDKCAICHAIVPDNVVRGPSMHGIAERAGTRVPGQDARTYLYASIMTPSEYLVEGFDDLMPKTLAKDLTGEELDAVVEYLLTFR